ncbi:Bug family tripartite tricarboxylate transporter substrate binding protein [Piscinibacter koreensis]|uniref:Tripartite tricarboxylate transporter substrate binding protein n=1 Tax=Piscinibacter koreensis TaxID=2742824 RepID=A0A7Y6TWK8_9BURK|nr:tripartite tricarboxylate transporter substrate binding protein [Schlegelella koreensis]NUZ06096.1 tripartite tricarboxylate transporter substrate binding protein [Schlegelella koreensis]
MPKIVLAAAFSGLLLLAGGAGAQSFPTKQVRLVIAFPPGGATDVVGRILARRLSDEFGQQVIVDNRAGAGGGLGTQSVARSEPDGHTLVFTVAGPITAVPHVNKDVGYRMSDLAPIAIVFRSPLLLVVPSTSPIRTLPDLLVRGKPANGQPAAYGSSGVGALSHLGSEMLNVAAGTSFVHVPYKGTPGTLQALLAGDIQWALATGNDSKGNLEAGKLRPLAVMSEKRSALFPSVPSMAELGLEGLDLDTWFGLFAPARTPQPTLDLLHRTVKKILGEPEFAARMRELGGETPTDANTPAAITAGLQKESAELQRIVKVLDIKAN